MLSCLWFHSSALWNVTPTVSPQLCLPRSLFICFIGLLLFLVLFFWNRFSLSIPRWPETYYVDLAGIELVIILMPLPPACKWAPAPAPWSRAAGLHSHLSPGLSHFHSAACSVLSRPVFHPLIILRLFLFYVCVSVCPDVCLCTIHIEHLQRPN